MEELERIEKKKEEADDRPRWETGLCACFMDPVTCAVGAVAPCVLFGALMLAGCSIHTTATPWFRGVGTRMMCMTCALHVCVSVCARACVRVYVWYGPGMSKQLLGEEPAANGIGFCLVGIPFAAACFFREQVCQQPIHQSTAKCSFFRSQMHGKNSKRPHLCESNRSRRSECNTTSGGTLSSTAFAPSSACNAHCARSTGSC
jgi:hypothetical protein